MIPPISFFVAGVAKPAGSKRGFYIPKIKRVVITDACKGSKDWKTDVRHEANRQYNGDLLTMPLKLKLAFVVERPASHYRTGKNAGTLRDSAPSYPTTRPDVLKLARAVEDALTSIVWKDDSQIVTEILHKRYGNLPGVHIDISEEAE